MLYRAVYSKVRVCVYVGVCLLVEAFLELAYDAIIQETEL